MKKNKFDLVFYCDANSNTGFGHASRCSKLGYILKKRKKNLKIGIKGSITYKAKLLIKKVCKNIIFVDNDNLHSKLSFVDKMFNSEDPNLIDKFFLNEVKDLSDKTVLMCSGTEIKYYDEDITYIGYQPKKNPLKKNNIYWSLDYAPTKIERIKNIKRKKGTVLLALGGHKDNKQLDLLISVINKIPSIKTLNILISPVNSTLFLGRHLFRKDLKVNIYSNLNDLSIFLENSSLVITSFGNLTYESIAYGAPSIVIAQKEFQKEYSKFLESEGLVLSLGYPSKIGINKTFEKVTNYILKNSNSSKRNKNKIALNGLENIANILLKNIQS